MGDGKTVQLRGTQVTGTSEGLRAYVATPDPAVHGRGPFPALVVAHEAFGVDANMRAIADRLASRGYLTVIPDLYTEGGAVRCLYATFRALQRGSGRAFQDIEAARVWAVRHPQCSGRVGIIGFCLGGSFALASVERGFAVSSVNYGDVPERVDEVVVGACPVVGTYGALDSRLAGHADRLRDALDRAGVDNDVQTHPDAGHAFLDPEPGGPWWLQPVFRLQHTGPHPEQAGLAWERIDAFLDRHLRAG